MAMSGGWIELLIERLHRKLADLDGTHHTGSRCRWCAKALEGVYLDLYAPCYCSTECRDEWTRALRRKRLRFKPRRRRRARG